ncbi:F-box [Trifolium pratense]|uniref:F-box n=1 Tax=Trifolium pratense TaxID=57577 RepID=A0A2K3NQK5_TRIPR|nr:F-box [Trifolium pratense]
MKFGEDLEIEILLRLPLKSLMSCDGVFCLKGVYRDTANYGHGQLIMWNPTTNEVHHIPRAPSRNTNDFSYGFGAVGGDFKVIRLTSYVKRMARLLCHSAEVYSLNSNLDLSPDVDILCFNFHNDEFRLLKSPSSTVPLTSYCHDLIEIKGSLGYVLQSNSAYNVCFQVWVIDQNNWSRKYVIETSMLNLRRFWNDAAEVFGGEAGELLESYDHHGKMLRQFQIEIPKNNYFKIYEYVPSVTLLSK